MSSSALPGVPMGIVRPDAPSVKVLLFDFGGTLDAEGVPWKERFFRLWNRWVAPVRRDRFDAAFYAADDALVGSVPVSTPFAETVELLTRGLVERLGGADAEAARRVATRFCDDSRRALASSGVLLERLARRYRLGVVSNFYGNLAAVCRDVGLERHLSAAVDSAAVGCSKPDPRIFRAALDRLAAEPREAVFVGDSIERDMAGARALGIRHVRLCGAGSEATKGCCAGDRVIRRLQELEEIFL